MSERIQWLDDFSNGINRAGSILSSVDYIGVIMIEAGNEHVGNRLLQLSEALDEALQKCDSAIGRMISDEVQESFRRTDETFVALLRAVVDTDATNPTTRGGEER